MAFKLKGWSLYVLPYINGYHIGKAVHKPCGTVIQREPNKTDDFLESIVNHVC